MRVLEDNLEYIIIQFDEDNVERLTNSLEKKWEFIGKDTNIVKVYVK